MGKRADIMGLTLWALSQRISKAELQRLLGSWVYIVGFCKEALSVLESSYAYVYQMQEHGRDSLLDSVVEELLTLVFLAPALQIYLRDSPVSLGKQCSVFAIDAEGSGGLGACVASTSRESWMKMFGCTEDIGDYTRLDWGD